MLDQPSPRLRPGRPFLATRIPVSVRTSQAWLRRFNSAFVSRLFRVASIAAMQRSLKPQSTGQHRGDPPAFARCAATGEGCRADAPQCVGGLYFLSATAWQAISPMWLSSDSSSFVNCRAHCPTRVRVSPSAPFRIRGEIIIILRFERRVCRWESCRMRQFMPR